MYNLSACEIYDRSFGINRKKKGYQVRKSLEMELKIMTK